MTRDALGRLSEEALPGVSSSRVSLPARRPSGIGIVHLGAGAFFRAHQAVFTERAFARGGADGWGILAVTGQRPDVADALRPQDGLYGVLERSDDADRVDVVGSVRDAAAGERDADRVAAAIAAEETHIVTLTITEKAYTGEPSRPLRTLRDGLQRRARSHGGALAVISCDNLRDNGAVLRAAMERIVDDRTRRWMRDAVTFPRTMVDRIVPATTDDDRKRAQALLGVRDEAVVVAEPFAQWVIADEFVGPRPEWERAGAILTDEVSRWEDMKIRTLNAAHLLLAYEGALRGHGTIHECAADASLASAVRGLMAQTAQTFTAPRGADVAGYQAQTLERFANPAIGHTVRQIAKDGTEKLPVRLLAPLRELRRRGAAADGFDLIARAVAAWMALVRVRPDLLDDPRAEAVGAAASASGDPRSLVTSLLTLTDVFGADLAADAVVVDALVDQVADLLRQSRTA